MIVLDLWDYGALLCLEHTIRKSEEKYYFQSDPPIICSLVHSFQELVTTVHVKIPEGTNIKNVPIWLQNQRFFV